MTHPDAQRAFEEKYQRSAQDPTSAEMLSIWNDAWEAATERAAILCEVVAGRASFVNNLGAQLAAEQCADEIRGTK